MRQVLLATLTRYNRQQHWQAAESHTLTAGQFCSTVPEEVLREIEQNKKDREEVFHAPNYNPAGTVLNSIMTVGNNLLMHSHHCAGI
jgi:hypothetical protein